MKGDTKEEIKDVEVKISFIEDSKLEIDIIENYNIYNNTIKIVTKDNIKKESNILIFYNFYKHIEKKGYNIFFIPFNYNKYESPLTLLSKYSNIPIKRLIYYLFQSKLNSLFIFILKDNKNNDIIDLIKYIKYIKKIIKSNNEIITYFEKKPKEVLYNKLILEECKIIINTSTKFYDNINNEEKDIHENIIQKEESIKFPKIKKDKRAETRKIPLSQIKANIPKKKFSLRDTSRKILIPNKFSLEDSTKRLFNEKKYGHTTINGKTTTRENRFFEKKLENELLLIKVHFPELEMLILLERTLSLWKRLCIFLQNKIENNKEDNKKIYSILEYTLSLLKREVKRAKGPYKELFQNLEEIIKIITLKPNYFNISEEMINIYKINIDFPCRIAHFIFRFLSLFLYSLKKLEENLSQEDKVEIAKYINTLIKEEIENISINCPKKEAGECNYFDIFKFFRKNSFFIEKLGCFEYYKERLDINSSKE